MPRAILPHHLFHNLISLNGFAHPEQRNWYRGSLVFRVSRQSNSILIAKYVEIHHAPQMPLHAINEIPFSCSTWRSAVPHPYLNLRASRSDSRRQRMSSSRTGRNLLVCVLIPISPSFQPLQHGASRIFNIWGCRTWALDVADNASGGIVHKLNSDLGDTSTGTCSCIISHSIAQLISSIHPQV